MVIEERCDQAIVARGTNVMIPNGVRDLRTLERRSGDDTIRDQRSPRR